MGAESILALVDRPDYSDDVVPTIPGAVLFLDAAPETMEVGHGYMGLRVGGWG